LADVTIGWGNLAARLSAAAADTGCLFPPVTGPRDDDLSSRFPVGIPAGGVTGLVDFLPFPNDLFFPPLSALFFLLFLLSRWWLPSDLG